MADVVLQKYCTTDNIRMLLFRKKRFFCKYFTFTFKFENLHPIQFRGE